MGIGISFDLYNIFYHVCELGSISKAANYLYVSQPAITRQINNLEKQLGRTLFERSTTGSTLTSDGKMLYNEIKDAMEKLNSVESIMNAKNKKYETVIKIVAGQSTIKNLLLDTISKYNLKHSNVIIELSTLKYQESIEKLREGSVDIIFFSMDEVTTLYNNIIVKKCYELNDSLIISKELKNKIPQKINILDINRYPVICKYGNSISRLSVEKFFIENGTKFIPKYELSNNWLVEEYVKMGMGIGIVAEEFVKEELKNGDLIKIETEQEIPAREIGYAIRKNSSTYPILKEFVKELTHNIASKK